MSETFRINRTEIDKLLKGRNGPVTLHIANIGRQLRGAMKAEAPKGETGKLREGIVMEMVQQSNGWTAQVISKAPYSNIVISGRGEVTPTNASVLHFTIGGVDIFTMRSKAVKANNFVKRAADKIGLRVRNIG